MPIGRIRTRATFRTLRHEGRRARSGALRVTHVPDSTAGDVRIAYAVGRAVGTAVVRNRVRRRLRAACAELSPPAGLYLITATPPAAVRSYAELRADLAAAFAQLIPAEPPS